MNKLITIDGPASSGKSTLGYGLANKLKYSFLDSGMVYRLGILSMQQKGTDPFDLEKASETYSNLDFRLVNQPDKQSVFLENGENDVNPLLHNPDITRIVTIVGSNQVIREKVREVQKRFAENKNTVMVGRDLGTEVFPSADLKFYITARPEVRAERRFTDLRKAGLEVTFDQVLKEILARDNYDKNREFSPMQIPRDAILIDTSEINIKTSQEKLFEISYEKLCLREGRPRIS